METGTHDRLFITNGNAKQNKKIKDIWQTMRCSFELSEVKCAWSTIQDIKSQSSLSFGGHGMTPEDRSGLVSVKWIGLSGGRCLLGRCFLS